MKKVIVSSVLLLLSSLCHAGGWTPDLTVSAAFTENSDLVVAYTSDGVVYTSGCQANAWILKADTDARRARAYATVMTAVVSGKKVRFWYSDTCDVWGYHGAHSVMLVQ